jgi:DNA primase
VRSQLTKLGLDKVVAMAERAITHKSDRFAEPDADASRVEASWEHALALNEFHVDLRRALKEAEKAYERTPTEGTLAAILEIQQRLALGKGTEAEGAGDA